MLCRKHHAVLRQHDQVTGCLSVCLFVCLSSWLPFFSESCCKLTLFCTSWLVFSVSYSTSLVRFVFRWSVNVSLHVCVCVCMCVCVSACVSERVGWVPADTEIPESVRSTYKWIEGLSVTEMEIMHGAYRKDNPNGMFCTVKCKVKASHARYRALSPELIPVYRQSARRWL